MGAYEDANLTERARREAVFEEELNGLVDKVTPIIRAQALREAARDAMAFSEDRSNRLLPRIAMRTASAWLRGRAADQYPTGIEEES